MAKNTRKCENCAFFEEFGVLGYCRFNGKSIVFQENMGCKKFLNKKHAEPCPCDSAPHTYCNNAEGCPCADYEEWVERMENLGMKIENKRGGAC